MKKSKISIILFIANLQILFAQIPHLTGEVKVSILNGTIESDLEYSNLPSLKNYSIFLNTGLNIKYFRNAEDNANYGFKKEYNNGIKSEAFQYYFPANDNKSKFLPNKFKINYVGKFPVINDTLKSSNTGDWKGNIAFNSESIRATEQSVWYPILYDIENDVEINNITYDITINCIDCKSIYLNGSEPIRGNVANFKSEKPITMMLFAGLFDFTKNKKTYFINTDLNSEQETVLANWTDKIISFYESKLKIPYGNPVTYLYTTPISKNNAWMFVTYPTIAIIGHEEYNVKSYFKPNTNVLKNTSNIEYFSHELGHYYFGTVMVPNSELRWVFLEGLTEYLALQTVKEVLGEENYQKKIDNYLKSTKEYTIKPLSTIKNSEIDNTYRYNYVPLLITALEKEVGKEKVWNWLRTILNSEKLVKTDYDFFKSSLLKSGVKETEFKKFEEKYILSENAKENVFKVVK
ncbi:gluzincin family metallopeptidase [Flavobacterium terrigena]|uniref:Peptidase M1 membrane alanine aminopeptidase domain-containing protein n=1 Tax=Flavobacterium terrigena TaxID=402734 RepID=A0A1H6UHP3_9FLAO|nr:hypothetical protein [Flavobacterium terrigena]SEI91799.1 hypothetical protein SAMN05660918_1914 [Flavobacterium terrigena]